MASEEENVPPEELVGLVQLADPPVMPAVWPFVRYPGTPAAMLGMSEPWVSKCSVDSSAAGMLLGS